MSAEQQDAMARLCNELDQLAGTAISHDLVSLFRAMDLPSLKACREDLQAIFAYHQQHQG